MPGSWYVAPALDALRDEINAAYPGRDRSSDGAIGDAAHAARKSDHNPAPDGRGGRIVRARDFDVDGIPVRPILDVLERDPRTGLLIWNHRYWTRGHGWRPYSGINPHTGHFHISVRAGSAYELDTRPWNLEDDMPTLDEVRAVVREEIARDRPNRRSDVYNAVWVFPEWTVPGTDRKENPGTFLSATRVASVQAVHAAGAAAGLTDADVDRLLAALADQLPEISAADIAEHLRITVEEA